MPVSGRPSTTDREIERSCPWRWNSARLLPPLPQMPTRSPARPVTRLAALPQHPIPVGMQLEQPTGGRAMLNIVGEPNELRPLKAMHLGGEPEPLSLIQPLDQCASVDT